MKYKKLLFTILVVVMVMFTLMLATSYAWYSFKEGSTTFDTTTSDKSVDIKFLKGEYINNTLAVPLSSSEIDQYSDKHQFVVKMKSNKKNNEVLLKISLIDIIMDDELKNSAFKIELYHQGVKVSEVTGEELLLNEKKEQFLKTVALDEQVDNIFEVRVYLFDDGSDQSLLMNKGFQAKIQTEVLSRMKTDIGKSDYSDISLSSIIIDGKSSKYLPISGYYSMTSTCVKGSKLSWDSYNKTLSYGRGSKINDSCSLIFTSENSNKFLNTVSVGSYVKYIGSNGCVGRYCEGNNANYVSDNNMGYCTDVEHKYFVNGWRVAYIQNGNAYLISAGSPECASIYVENKSSNITIEKFDRSYYYGTGYDFDEKTGKYHLTGVVPNLLFWENGYKDIIDNSPYTCKSTSLSGGCDVMYKVVGYHSPTEGQVITYNNFDENISEHISKLNQIALKYCNSNFIDGGECSGDNVKNIDDDSYQSMNMSIKKLEECYGTFGSKSCGYNNSLIDNGGNYWLTSSTSSSSQKTFFWNPGSRAIDYGKSSLVWGVRPVLRLRSSVKIVGGAGTYSDPYIIQ